MHELAGRKASLAFRDIARNRNRGATELARKSKHLFSRKRSSHAVHRCRQIHGLLPCNRISKRLHGHNSLLRMLLLYSLFTNHYSLSLLLYSLFTTNYSLAYLRTPTVVPQSD